MALAATQHANSSFISPINVIKVNANAKHRGSPGFLTLPPKAPLNNQPHSPSAISPRLIAFHPSNPRSSGAEFPCRTLPNRPVTSRILNQNRNPKDVRRAIESGKRVSTAYSFYRKSSANRSGTFSDGSQVELPVVVTSTPHQARTMEEFDPDNEFTASINSQLPYLRRHVVRDSVWLDSTSKFEVRVSLTPKRSQQYPATISSNHPVVSANNKSASAYRTSKKSVVETNQDTSSTGAVSYSPRSDDTNNDASSSTHSLTVGALVSSPLIFKTKRLWRADSILDTEIE